MPSGLDAGRGYTAAPTDLPGYGDIQWESMAGRDTSRGMVGGSDWGPDMTGFGPATGFERLAAGPGPQAPIPGQAGNRVTDWRMAFNPGGPTLWIMVFTLAAVGFIHARVNLHAGPAHMGGGVG